MTKCPSAVPANREWNSQEVTELFLNSPQSSNGMHEYLLLFYSEIILKAFVSRVACKVYTPRRIRCVCCIKLLTGLQKSVSYIVESVEGVNSFSTKEKCSAALLVVQLWVA